VEIGKSKDYSPIITAIQEAEEGSTGTVRVHLSKRFVEPKPFQRALRIFRQYEMANTPQRNTVLFYINLRRKRFAVVGDVGVHRRVGQEYWEKVLKELAEDLRSTQSEKAIALAIDSVGKTLKKFFPK